MTEPSESSGNTKWQTIQQAVAMAWETFRREHPAQAESVERIFAQDDLETLAGLIRKLDEDEQYRKLVARTSAETNLAELAGAVGPILLQVVTTLLAAV